MNTLYVELEERSYPIYIGEGLLGQLDIIKQHINGRQVLVVSNETIAPLYLENVVLQLETLGLESVDSLVLRDGERYKNTDTLNLIFTALLESRHNRSTTLIALGGGVIGDMTGFAAACYQRGVAFIQIPTTLLAQVDSSVGGKTAVNHPLGKNMIGAFHQPNCVVADTATLRTLPEREFRAGLAEVIKYGLISDAAFFEWLEANMQPLLDRDSKALAYAIEASCRNKAKVVGQDETERGLRAILNLGHTFGHAIETVQGYRDWLHGEAIAAGMVMAAELSVRLGKLTPGDYRRAKALISSAGLPVVPPASISESEFRAAMSVDKKVTGGGIRLVLLSGVGCAFITDDFDDNLLSLTLNGSNLTD